MAKDREDEVRLQFLDEAQEYLDNIETGLLGIGSAALERQRLDSVLRAAHSIKGGAGMMGYTRLSQLAHRIEDFFKVLKTGKKEVDEELERLLLLSVDLLRQIVVFNRQKVAIDDSWLEANASPIFDLLHDRLGDPQPEDTAALLSEEAGEDMKVLLFETEVEGCLQRLESVLADPEMPCLAEEFLIVAQELGGLGEMLELSAFTSLCESIAQKLETSPEQKEAIAKAAIKEWRRSQAMVLVGQLDAIPSQLNLSELETLQTKNLQIPSPSPLLDVWPRLEEDPTLAEELEDFTLAYNEPIESELITTQDFQAEAQEFLASLNALKQDEPELTPVLEKVAPIPVKEVQKPEIEKIPSRISQPVTISEPAPAAVSKAPEQNIRVSVRQLEQLGELFGELTIERNGLTLQLKRLRNYVHLLSQRVRTLEQSNFRLRNAYDKVATDKISTSNSAIATENSSSYENNEPENGGRNFLNNLTGASDFNSQFDLLEMDRYSDLHLLSREVMDTVVQIQEVSSDIEISIEDADRAARELTRTTKLMQKNFTQMRMRPFSALVSHFPRALREMSLEYKKKVDLKLKGESTLVERSILDTLSDPMLQLLRNSFDHGIETPEVRKAAGKPEQGTIEISAAHRSNQIVITLSDDGCGINLDKIRARALKMGFNSEDLAAVSQKELLELIFQPGFSTASKVTGLSGRGVGMDIVRTNLQQIKGAIYVDTKPGQGTTFTITVPLTLSVVRVLLVESEGMLMAFPNNTIEEMVVLEPQMVSIANGKEVMNWEGNTIPLIRLGQRLHFSSFHPVTNKENTPAIDRPIVLVVAQGQELVGIQVDRYWEEQEVTIRQVEGNIKMPPGFSGCTILGDGLVIPLVDVIGLLRWINNETELQSNSLTHKGTSNIRTIQGSIRGKDNVLVVDDSINVRRFLSLTLEKAGYRAEEAKDGQDALEKLQAGLPVQAVICDIEMPRLDGYGFLAHIKSDPVCQNIPVIMLTSRSGDKHRQLAINLGATAYFSKPFREAELLKTLEQILKNN